MTLRTVVFATRVDAWLVLVIAAALAICVPPIVFGFREGVAAGTTTLAVIGAPIVLVALVAVPTRYVLGAEELVVRSGILRWVIPLGLIERVYHTRNPGSSPAWSLRRLGIDYRKGQSRRLILISPRDREEFLILLAERSGLEPTGRELRRSVPATPSR